MHPLAAEFDRLDREARDHKRASGHHRRLAQEARARQAEIAAECRRLGISIETVIPTGEGDHHGPHHRSTA